MSYDAVIEQVRALLEYFLTSVSAFIKLLETEQDNFFTAQITPEEKSKQAFF